MAQKGYLQIRIDPVLLKAIQKHAEENFIDTSSLIRMVMSQYPPIKKILEEMKETQEQTSD